MALYRARVLYDFDGEPGTAELSIQAGETLKVTRTDIGEGWLEGENARGASGLFPEAYVERAPGPPAAPPPALPPAAWEPLDDDWDAESDDDNYQQIGAGREPEPERARRQASDAVSVASMASVGRGAPPARKGRNLFASSAKAALENYVLGLSSATPSNRVQIDRENDLTYRWPPIAHPYTVQITSPKKQAKLGGLKTFIAYQLTPSTSNIAVDRRYKHFDWLHARLTEKFHVIAIPPLPDKQISGRYEDDFIEHRRAQLQEFVNYVCRHPILSQCDVWQHFLTCTNEKEWKEGKRRAEKDAFIGPNYCMCVDAPEKELLNSTVEHLIESRSVYIGQIDHAVKMLLQCAVEQRKKNETMFKRENQKVGESFLVLANSLNNSADFSSLSDEMKHIGISYTEVASYFGSQFKLDWQPLTAKLYLYRGITNAFVDIFSLQKAADMRKRDYEKNASISGMQPGQLGEIRRRIDVLTYAVFAELDHFHREINSEFKMAMREFVTEQLNFHRKIVQRFETTLSSIG